MQQRYRYQHDVCSEGWDGDVLFAIVSKKDPKGRREGIEDV